MAKPLAKFVKLLTPKRRWFPFRLRTLFVLVANVAVPCAWLAWGSEHKRQRTAVAENQRLSGTVSSIHSSEAERGHVYRRC